MPDIVVIQDSGSQIVVQGGTALDVSSPGPQGPPGPQGDPGAPGGATFTHVQSVAASQWNINHGLGRYPHVTLIDTLSGAGDTFLGLVQYVDDDNISIVLNQPVAGRAEIS